MDLQQVSAATCAMIRWLSSNSELGALPAAILFEQSFVMDELTYYVFKYQIKPGGIWYLGVAGGYAKDSLQHCGHVWSDMRPYVATDAVTQATSIVEKLKVYWKARVDF